MADCSHCGGINGQNERFAPASANMLRCGDIRRKVNVMAIHFVDTFPQNNRDDLLVRAVIQLGGRGAGRKR